MSVDESVHKSSKLAYTHTNDITSATSVNDLSSHPVLTNILEEIPLRLTADQTVINLPLTHLETI